MNASCPRCGAAIPSVETGLCPRCLLLVEPAGSLIGGAIALEEEIGRGGMGSVFRALHIPLDRVVAVKFLPAELAADREFQARFEREAHILALLDHPNIVTVHDFGCDEGHSYIVMEHVAGAPLAAQIRLAPRRAIEVARQVCAALAHAHGRGVVHRDIKPENILIAADGRVKVTDFGIARLVAPSPGAPAITRADHAAGTPYYLAPEAVHGAPPDPRMDLYSLGVVLHQMLTGSLPAAGIAPHLGGLERVVRRALAADPRQRYGSAEEMDRDLAAVHVGDAAALAHDSQEDRPWIYAVALLLTVATATALWAFLVSVTPRILSAEEVMPLVMVPPERLGDGRVLSRARFETWPILAALAAFAAALGAAGLLRFYWMRSDLIGGRPDQRIREARWVLVAGILACMVFAIGRPLPQRGLVLYLPIIGGVIEVAALFLLWTGILQAWRNGRSLRHEPGLWIGFALALLPPVTEFAYTLATWKP